MPQLGWAIASAKNIYEDLLIRIQSRQRLAVKLNLSQDIKHLQAPKGRLVKPPQNTTQECIQKAVLSTFGNEFENFYKKIPELHRLCEKIANTKLRDRAIIDIEQVINVVKSMADSGIIEITVGPFGGIDKIRVLKRPHDSAGST